MYKFLHRNLSYQQGSSTRRHLSTKLSVGIEPFPIFKIEVPEVLHFNIEERSFDGIEEKTFGVVAVDPRYCSFVSTHVLKNVIDLPSSRQDNPTRLWRLPAADIVQPAATSKKRENVISSDPDRRPFSPRFQPSLSLAQQFLVAIGQSADLDSDHQRALAALLHDQSGGLAEYAQHVAVALESALASLCNVMRFEAGRQVAVTSNVVGLGDYVHPHIRSVMLKALGIRDLAEWPDDRMSNAMRSLVIELYSWIGLGIRRPYGQLTAIAGQPIHIKPVGAPMLVGEVPRRRVSRVVADESVA